MDITINELRTGNLFQYFIGEDGCEWDITKLDWQDIKWCEEENENFNKVHKPIPLTEDWIEDFGFRLQSVSKHDFRFNKVLRTDKLYTTNPFNLDDTDTFEIEVIKDGDALTKNELVLQERGEKV